MKPDMHQAQESFSQIKERFLSLSLDAYIISKNCLLAQRSYARANPGTLSEEIIGYFLENPYAPPFDEKSHSPFPSLEAMLPGIKISSGPENNSQEKARISGYASTSGFIEKAIAYSELSRSVENCDNPYNGIFSTLESLSHYNSALESLISGIFEGLLIPQSEFNPFHEVQVIKSRFIDYSKKLGMNTREILQILSEKEEKASLIAEINYEANSPSLEKGKSWESIFNRVFFEEEE
jgi:hypothetical protein